MNINNKRNKEKGNIYFSDAIKQIDESLEYNEYSEINSSDYFKDSLYKAEDEVDKLMLSPLMTNFKRYKNKRKKLSLDLLKKNKDVLINKIKLLNEKCKEKEITEKIKKITKSEKLKKLKIRKRNFDNILNVLESAEDQNKNLYLNLNLKYETNSLLPPINNLKTMNTINNENTKKEEIFKKGIYTERRKRKEEIRDNILAVTGGIVKSLSLRGKNVIKHNNDINDVPKNDDIKN